jgi:hypothetical protein
VKWKIFVLTVLLPFIQNCSPTEFSATAPSIASKSETDPALGQIPIVDCPSNGAASDLQTAAPKCTVICQHRSTQPASDTLTSLVMPIPQARAFVASGTSTVGACEDTPGVAVTIPGTPREPVQGGSCPCQDGGVGQSSSSSGPSSAVADSNADAHSVSDDGKSEAGANAAAHAEASGPNSYATACSCAFASAGPNGSFAGSSSSSSAGSGSLQPVSAH